MENSQKTEVDFDRLTALNNEIINMQRDLYKKNAQISELLKSKEKLNEELILSNETKDRIFSVIGHDLRAPLATIIDSINLITVEKSSYDSLVQKNFFEELRDSTGDTMILLENLLEWSRSQLGELTYYPQKFNLNESISTGIRILSVNAKKKNITISEDFVEKTYVCADIRMIDTVLRNLVSNAIKFTNAGGEVTIRIETDVEFARIKVIDNGVGMSPEKIGALFIMSRNTVSTGTNGEKGTGFGLMLCKNLVEKNGGSLMCESVVGKGSTFTFTIPLVAEI